MRDPSEMGELFNQLAEMAKGKSAFLLHLQICQLNLVLLVSFSAPMMAITVLY